jgi:O-acetyl-ADP-ribose deacetylase (regulator of RNase III)
MTQFQDVIGNCTISVSIGNLEAEKADAYLVPHFSPGVNFGGVAGAVARTGGGLGVNEYADFVRRNGAQPFGQAKVTDSYGGNAAYLIHTVTVGSGAEAEFEAVRQGTLNALRACSENGLHKLVAPGLGTGIVGELLDEQCAKAMLSAVDLYAKEGGKPLEISLVFWKGEPENARSLAAAFQKVLNDKSYVDAPAEIGARNIDPARWARGMNHDAASNDAYARANPLQLQSSQPVKAKPIRLKKPGL